MKKLKLEKSTIANLNEEEMTKVEGGQETLAGPRCPSLFTCGTDPSIGCITNENPCQ